MNSFSSANSLRSPLVGIAALVAAGGTGLAVSLSSLLVAAMGPGRNGRALVLVAACLLLAGGMCVPIERMGNRLLRLWHRLTKRPVDDRWRGAWLEDGRVRQLRPALTLLAAFWLLAAAMAICVLLAVAGLLGLDRWLSERFFWPGNAAWILRLFVALLATCPLLAVGVGVRLTDGLYAAGGGGRGRIAVGGAALAASAVSLAISGVLSSVGVSGVAFLVGASLLWLLAAVWAIQLSMRRLSDGRIVGGGGDVSRSRRWGARATLFVLALAFTGWAAGWQRVSQLAGSRWPGREGVLWLICVLCLVLGALGARKLLGPGAKWRTGVALAVAGTVGALSLLHVGWMVRSGGLNFAVAAVLEGVALAGPVSLVAAACTGLIARELAPGGAGTWLRLLRPVLTGTAAGSVLWIQWLVPMLGTAASMAISGLLVLAAGGCWIVYDRALPASRRAVYGGAVLLLAISLAVVTPLQDLPFWLLGSRGGAAGLPYVREGHSRVYSLATDSAGRVSVRVDRGYRRLLPDISAAGAALPFRLHPRVRRMLLIDAAWPLLVREADSRLVAEIDIAGQEAASVEAQRKLLGGMRHRARWVWHRGDLRDVLSRERRYDMIVMGPFPVAHPHAGHRYSLQRVERVLSRLADGGVACMYVPLGGISTDVLKILVETAAMVGFQAALRVEVWLPGDSMAVIVFSRGGLGASRPEGHLGWLNPPFAEGLIERDDRPLLIDAAWRTRERGDCVSDCAALLRLRVGE